MEYKKLILVFFMLPVNAWGRTWTVIHKGQSPQGPYVIVDAGSEDGVREASRICIKDPEGSDLACGQVTILKAKATGVRLTEAELATVSLGSIAVLDGEDFTNQEVSLWRRRLSGRLISPLAQTFIYDAIRFNDSARSNVALPTWVKSETVKKGALGLAWGWEEPITETYAVSIGGLLTQNHDIENRVQLQPLRDGKWVNSITSGYNFGITCDVDWKIFTTGGFLLQSGTGLAIMNGVVEMSAEYRDNGVTTKVAEYRGKLWSLFAEADLEAHFATGDLAIFGGLRFAVPVAKLTDSYDGKTDFSTVDLGDASYSVSSIGRAIDLRTANGYAIEVGISFAL